MTAKAWSANSDHATSITRPSLTPPAGQRPYRSGLRAYSGNSTKLYCCKMVAQRDRVRPLLNQATSLPRAPLMLSIRDIGGGCRGLCARQSRAIWHLVFRLLLAKKKTASLEMLRQSHRDYAC